MKKMLSLMLAATMVFSLAACGGGNDATSDNTQAAKKAEVPNNGEWDDILCSGDGYHLVKKEIDDYDKYKVMVGVVDDAGEWVQELTDEGPFAEAIQLRVDTDDGDVLLDKGSYMYLGEGIFIGSPGLTVYSADSEYKLGPWESGWLNSESEIIQGWECLFWNVKDNTQKQFYATKMSMFQDGYSLFIETAKQNGVGTLKAITTNGQITELPCKYDSYWFNYKFPVYSDGLFFAQGPAFQTGFYDIEGNLVVDLTHTDIGKLPYCEEFGVNAPYFKDGKATILFKNNGGSVFKGIIDKTGEFVGEPEKYDIKTK